MTTIQIDHPARLTRVLVTGGGNKDHTLGFQQSTLPVRPTEGETGSQGTILKNDPMTGNHAGFRIGMEGESDEPGIPGSTCQGRYLTVRGHLARRYASDDLIYQLRKGLLVSHAPIVCMQRDKPDLTDQQSTTLPTIPRITESGVFPIKGL